jgi:hypothetical protein
MFIIQSRDGRFYTGVGFTSNKEKAVRFQTKQEAEKRTRLRSDLVVVPYEQANYTFESHRQD